MNAATRRYRPADPYLSEIAAAPLLDAAGERDLARRVAAGDAEARDLLVRANLRLVVALARGYRGRGVAPEDLIAEGNLGLIRAAEAYDPGLGTRFGTYASYWIRQSMRGAVMRHGEPVRLPQYMVTLLARWRRVSSRLSTALGREATPSEVSEALGLTARRAGMVASAMAMKAAMPRQAGEAGSGSHLGDVAAGEMPAEDRAAEAEEASAALDRVDRLDGRSREVVRLRFGLRGEGPLPLREVADRLGLSREWVRHLERDALRSLATT